MFWADANTGSVMKAKMDGSNRLTLVDNLNNPEGVTVDVKDDRLVSTLDFTMTTGKSISKKESVPNWNKKIHRHSWCVYIVRHRDRYPDR